MKKLTLLLFLGAFFVFSPAVVNAALPEEEICVITPVSGMFFDKTQITIICGSRVVKSSYYWGNEKPKTFNKSVKTVYNAEKFQALSVSYVYYGADKKKKPRTYTWHFKSGQNTCEITPNGGAIQNDQSTVIQVKCGKNVRNATYQWGSEKAQPFQNQIGVPFENRTKTPLLIRFQYPLSAKSRTLRQAMVSAEFSPKYCSDSDGGIDQEYPGAATASDGNGKLTDGSDACIDNDTLKEFYCTKDGIASKSIKCQYGCSEGACNFAPDKQFFFDREASCATACENQTCPLKSSYLKNDSEAIAVAAGNTTAKLASPIKDIASCMYNYKMSDIGSFSWRVYNALQMAGYTGNIMMPGRTIDKKFILELDCRLAKAEAAIDTRAAKLPNFSSISGPDFGKAIPQKYAAYSYAAIFDLYNVGGNYFDYDNQCLLASLCYQVPEALANGCSGRTYSGFDQNKTVQTPGLFGFNFKSPSGMNIGYYGALTQSSQPSTYPNVMLYQKMLVHEFTHWLDNRLNYPVSFCTGKSFNLTKSDSPFNNVSSNNQSDFVSRYAMTNPIEDAAESVTSYIVYPEYFRMKAERRPVLKIKYDYIKNNLFNGYEFSNPYAAKPNQLSKYLYELPYVTGSLIRLSDKFMLTDISYAKKR